MPKQHLKQHPKQHNETASIKQVNCPTCKKPVAWVAANDYRPFCSQRCQAIDFGEWSNESYKIPARPDINELDEEALEDLVENQQNDSANRLH
ncbi:MAG: DNA gyrase inhibitor YacG [Gammaproteobacteria bacterium]|nr:MAG: DNA gyrase inhibitor YacG [Pseudomonadota bacterium]PIE38230.1 MAG: DNA gyrase inhibitor YacG [Gammaproteobacteria bacterium]